MGFWTRQAFPEACLPAEASCGRDHCSFAYSALACFRMGMSGVGVLPEHEEILIGTDKIEMSAPVMLYSPGHQTHFLFNSASQFSTSVRASAGDPVRSITQNFWPSAETS